MKEYMFFGCYDGEGNRVKDDGDNGDVLGELQEEEIMWGEPVVHQKSSPLCKEAKSPGAGSVERKKVMQVHGGGDEDADGYRSVLSKQMGTSKEHHQRRCARIITWAGNDAMSAALAAQKKGAMVPMMMRGMDGYGVDDGDDDERGGGEGRHGSVDLPPHELLARQYAATFSVLHGAGRTLKGMDLRRLRNEVWRQTGFID